MDPPRLGEGDLHNEALVDEITRALSNSGKYVTQIETRPTQGLVDLHWAAHRAGRRLGIKVRVLVERAERADARVAEPSVTVTVIPRRHDYWRLRERVW